MASIFRTPAARMLAMAAPPLSAMIARMNVAPRVGVAAFHTTKKMQIFPAGPRLLTEYIVNTPAPFPDANPSFERVCTICLLRVCLIVSAALIPLTGSLHPIIDAVLAATVVIIHSHIRFQYRTMSGLHRFMHWFLNGCTTLVLLGRYEFVSNDVGITEAIKRIWKA
ncbi:hypothetical protein L211DRAFT_863739 [Terfezia boudieri ATCC MYA-4762]|uniref:Succinate dehydrogenase [ubiquinone] cytochrome b small subunit n=1 Tax=Terfezia boudieri ATCC MYA-4762 TaxID=1051890 RepID=A0A3N4L861_9PEZI|nr:hypothetical protein L211DRAFT_863739 [Terfezia boudieri ATCC MYA-4762]